MIHGIVASQYVFAAPVDPYLVAHLPLSTDLTDTKGTVWTPYGGAAVSGGDLPLDGSTQYLSTPNNTDHDLGGGDFTVEAFVNFSAITECAIWCKWFTGGPFVRSFFMGINGASKMVIYYTQGGIGVFPNGSNNVSTGVEHHLAWYRQAGVLYVAIDGVVEVLDTSGATFETVNLATTIGASSVPASFAPVNGIRDLRVKKGISLYGASNFTPPTPPLP